MRKIKKYSAKRIFNAKNKSEQLENAGHSFGASENWGREMKNREFEVCVRVII